MFFTETSPRTICVSVNSNSTSESPTSSIKYYPLKLELLIRGFKYPSTYFRVVFVVKSTVEFIATMDASFADSLAKALTGLTIGKAVVKLTARPGEQQPPPVVVQLDYIPHEARRTSIYTSAFDPGEPKVEHLKSMLNPVLKYIEPARPLEFFALYALYVHGELAIADLATRLEARREDVEDTVNALVARGFVDVYREGNKKMACYVKGLFKGLKKVAPSEEGYKLAGRVLLYYARRGYVVAPVRQIQGSPRGLT